MASISDLQKKLRLESEIDAVQLAIAREDSAKERRALLRVLKKIQKELDEFKIEFPGVEPGPVEPVLPDSSYREPMPSVRAKFRSSWSEGAPSRRHRH